MKRSKEAQEPAPEWLVAERPVPYAQALSEMEMRVGAIADGRARERIWLLEHPPVLTAGTSAEPSDLIQKDRLDVVPTGRGGRYTFHGPGQRIVYPMLDLGRRGRDVRRYVAALEGWAIAALQELGILAFTHPAGTGIWVMQGNQPAKIGAIGVRVRRWVTYHGFAINVDTDLSHYEAIIPCGIKEYGVTRIRDVSEGIDMNDLDSALHVHLSAFLVALSDISCPLMKTLEAGDEYR